MKKLLPLLILTLFLASGSSGAVVQDSRTFNVMTFSVRIDDESYRKNIDTYIRRFNEKKSIVLPGEETEREINIKPFVNKVYYDYQNDRLIVELQWIDGRTTKLKDMLWSFFDGNPPNVFADRIMPLNGTKHTLITISGTRLEGVIITGTKEKGSGFFGSEKGDGYDGEFLGDKFHGRGRVIFPNGDDYDGEFKDGEENGIGKTYNC